MLQHCVKRHNIVNFSEKMSQHSVKRQKIVDLSLKKSHK